MTVRKDLALDPYLPSYNLLRYARTTLIHLVFRNQRGYHQNLGKVRATSRAHFSISFGPIMKKKTDADSEKIATAIRALSRVTNTTGHLSRRRSERLYPNKSIYPDPTQWLIRKIRTP